MSQNLDDIGIYQQELSYAANYQKKSFPARLSFIFSMALGALLYFLEQFFAGYDEQIKISLAILLFISTFFSPIYTLIFARCPKCNKTQPAGFGSAEVGKGIELSYSKGFTPFRKRCYFCGTYLSVKKLEKDRLKQQNKQKLK